jgi:hypothetical protein
MEPRKARRAAFPAWAAAFLALAGCAEEEPAGAGGHPLVAEPAFLEFPRITFGESSLAWYELRNQGSEPLSITRIGPSGCQCAELRLELPERPPEQRFARVPDGGPPLVLAPGESARLGIKLDTSRYREPRSRIQRAGFPVMIQGHEALVLEYAADIWTPFQVEPWAVEMGSVGVRERPTGVVGVQAHDETDFHPIVPEEVDGWRFEMRGGGGEKPSFRILVTAPEELPLGPFLKEFQFRTDLAGAPPIRFTVQGVAEPDITWSPRKLSLLPGRTAAVEVWTRAVGGTFRVTDARVIAAFPKGFQVAIEPVEEGRRYRVLLTYEGSVPEGGMEGALRALTDHRERRTLAVPFRLEAAESF